MLFGASCSCSPVNDRAQHLAHYAQCTPVSRMYVMVFYERRTYNHRLKTAKIGNEGMMQPVYSLGCNKVQRAES